MKRTLKMMLGAIAVLSAAATTMGAEGKSKSPQEQIKDIIENAAESATLPPTTDKNGNLKAVKFVGVGVLHKSFPKAMRLKKAASDAQTSARKAAAQFFNTRIKWAKESNGEIVCKIIGSSQGESEGNSTSESVATELTKEQSRECSQAALSGLVYLDGATNNNGLYVVVLGWNPKTSAFASAAAKIMGKTARETITEERAAKGASLQDPNEAYRKAAAKDEESNNGSASQNSGNSNGSSSSRNSAPTVKSNLAPGAEDFF